MSESSCTDMEMTYTLQIGDQSSDMAAYTLNISVLHSMVCSISYLDQKLQKTMQDPHKKLHGFLISFNNDIKDVLETG